MKILFTEHLLKNFYFNFSLFEFPFYQTSNFNIDMKSFKSLKIIILSHSFKFDMTEKILGFIEPKFQKIVQIEITKIRLLSSKALKQVNF